MKVLLAGAYGQVGQQLIRSLSNKIGIANVICADVRTPPENVQVSIHQHLDLRDKTSLYNILQKHQIKHVYCLAALLSATGEKDPLFTQQLNMKSLINCLQAARQGKVERIFWPSSIAAFGVNTPKQTPQFTIMQPETMYGITKKSGQLWCSYYNRRYGVDVRSVRFPGLIGYRSPPGGGTTDYAVDIYHKAILGEKFTCNLKQDAYLPMVYTDDAIQGTIQLMDVPKDKIKIRTSYNIGSMSFCPKQIAAVIKNQVPSFTMDYKIDPLRQKIAQSWPHQLLDEHARQDWGWNPKFNLQRMTKQILIHLTPALIKSMHT